MLVKEVLERERVPLPTLISEDEKEYESDEETPIEVKRSVPDPVRENTEEVVVKEDARLISNKLIAQVPVVMVNGVYAIEEEVPPMV